VKTKTDRATETLVKRTVLAASQQPTVRPHRRTSAPVGFVEPLRGLKGLKLAVQTAAVSGKPTTMHDGKVVMKSIADQNRQWALMEGAHRMLEPRPEAVVENVNQEP
jgi:hypothetical protein